MQKKIYELTVVTAEEIGEKKVKEMVGELLEKVGGRLVDFVFQGRKEVIYPIKKHAAANFSFVEVELESLKAVDLGKRIRMNDNILRYLLVSAPVVKAGKVNKKAKKTEVVEEAPAKEKKTTKAKVTNKKK